MTLPVAHRKAPQHRHAVRFAKNIFLVTRLKRNAVYTVLARRPVSRKETSLPAISSKSPARAKRCVRVGSGARCSGPAMARRDRTGRKRRTDAGRLAVGTMHDDFPASTMYDSGRETYPSGQFLQRRHQFSCFESSVVLRVPAALFQYAFLSGSQARITGQRQVTQDISQEMIRTVVESMLSSSPKACVRTVLQ